MNTIAIVSGGLDSTVLVYALKAQGYHVDVLSFDYGQRHTKELQFAQKTARDLGLRFDLLDLRAVGRLLSNALTTDGISVPEGHYADANMRATVVQNRNTIMLSIAFGIAASRGLETVSIGVHSGDHTIYPDCRPEFVHAFNAMQQEALGEWWQVELLAPFVNLSKADIVTLGHDLKVPFVNTWSCYNGKEVHCGKCGTCIDPLKPAAIAKAIEYFIDNPSKARQMGKNGKKAILKKYSWENESKKLLELYENLFSS